MALKINYFLSGLGLLALLISCDSGPKVIKSRKKEVKSELMSESYFDWGKAASSASEPKSFSEMVHKVVVKETLPAQRYTYLKVVEKGEDLWLATRKGEYETGATYFYRDGLLKKNFHSKEYDRTFERIYLVSKLVPEKHGGNQLSNPNAGAQAVKIETHSSSPASQPYAKKGSSISIAELIKNPSQFEGQIVELSGNCVKVNPNIMQRNWIHVKDGSADHFDLVVTTRSQVTEGQPVHLKAKVVLNKDFGAGYTYDLILEEGVIL